MALKQPCVPKDAFVNKIRELGYAFVEQKRHVDLWRRPTPQHYITVPRKQLVPLAHVRASLDLAGRPMDEIERFIATAQTGTDSKIRG